jgi:hypothetical protein
MYISNHSHGVFKLEEIRLSSEHIHSHLQYKKAILFCQASFSVQVVSQELPVNLSSCLEITRGEEQVMCQRPYRRRRY